MFSAEIYQLIFNKAFWWWLVDQSILVASELWLRDQSFDGCSPQWTFVRRMISISSSISYETVCLCINKCVRVFVNVHQVGLTAITMFILVYYTTRHKARESCPRVALCIITVCIFAACIFVLSYVVHWCIYLCTVHKAFLLCITSNLSTHYYEFGL